MKKKEMIDKKSGNTKELNHKLNNSLLYLQINNQKIQKKKLKIQKFHFLPLHNISTYKSPQKNSSSNIVLPSIGILSQNTSQKNINYISYKNNDEKTLNNTEKNNKKQIISKIIKYKNQITDRNSLLKKNSFLLSHFKLSKRNLKSFSLDNRLNNNNLTLKSYNSYQNFQNINNYNNINNNQKIQSNSYLSIIDNQFQSIQYENNTNKEKIKNSNLTKCNSFKQSNQNKLNDVFKILKEKFLKKTN